MDSAVDQLLVRCPTLAELAWVDSIEALTFTSDPSAGRMVCSAAEGSRDLTLLQERAYQAVLLFSWIRFDSPLPWTDEELDGWLAHAIHGVDFRDDAQYSFCCEAGGVIVVQTNNLWVLTASGLREIWQATLSLAALFAHEARHNEGYGHTCGPNDQTVAELGSWGAAVLLSALGRHPLRPFSGVGALPNGRCADRSRHGTILLPTAGRAGRLTATGDGTTPHGKSRLAEAPGRVRDAARISPDRKAAG